MSEQTSEKADYRLLFKVKQESSDLFWWYGHTEVLGHASKGAGALWKTHAHTQTLLVTSYNKCSSHY